MLNWTDLAIVATAPHNFAGAATACMRTMSVFAAAGAEATFVSLGRCYRADEAESHGIRLVTPRIRSDAYPTSDAVASIAVTQVMVRQAADAAARGRKPVLFGTYLFPFCQCARVATDILARTGVQADCVVMPAGSDVWQVGRQAPDVMRALLSGEEALRVTFSSPFVEEIETICGPCGPFSIIPPPVDTRRFSPATDEQRIALRRHLGVAADRLTILACNNMRPVKGINHTIRVAIEVARRRPTTLLLVGPVTESLKTALRDVTVEVSPQLPSPPFRVTRGNLDILLTGLQHDTVAFHQASDLALATSYHDSFNISLAESLACGTPIVSSDVVGIADIVREYECGLLFPFDRNPLQTMPLLDDDRQADFDLTAVAARILELSENPGRLRGMGSRAFQAARARYSTGAVRGLWEELLRIEV